LRPIAVSALIVALLGTPVAADIGERTSTLADQRAVSLTIYNQDLALVRDERAVHLAPGENVLAMRDVSGKIMPQTALLESLTAPSAVSVREQNFNYDLLSRAKLFEKYIGKDVTVVHTRVGSADVRETARVLAFNDNNPVLQYHDRIEAYIDGYVSFPSLPENLRDRPTLVLDIDNSGANDQRVALSYLTGGLSWSADYVGTLSAHDDRMDLTGLVTLNNVSGTTYRNARLQLVAGDVNVARAITIGAVRSGISAFQPQQPEGTFAEQSLFEYHLYTLNRPTTIADNQTKQVSLLVAHDIPVTKTLELRGSPFYYRQSSADLGDRLKVGTYVTFVNDGGELGIPLPKGTFRIYKHDGDGHSQFIGSDTIDHTPKKETVRLFLGSSFDVVAHKKQTDFKILTTCEDASSYEIVLTNGKTTAENVTIVEPIPGDWTITSESAPHVKTSSSTANWTLAVPPLGKTTLTYTARTVYCADGHK
jgi:hypothetical protein